MLCMDIACLVAACLGRNDVHSTRNGSQRTARKHLTDASVRLRRTASPAMAIPRGPGTAGHRNGRDRGDPQPCRGAHFTGRVIAELAVSGLTNKQIGHRIYLSHRTAGAHLYRVFDKTWNIDPGGTA
jgi:hypothetical protein